MYRMMTPIVVLFAGIVAVAESSARADQGGPEAVSPKAAPDTKKGLSFRYEKFLQYQEETFPVRGRFDGVQDGWVVLSRPIPAGVRKSISRAKEIPLSRVPERTVQRVLLHQVPYDDVEQWKGKDVIATVFMDRKGFFYLLGLKRDYRPETR